MPVGIRLYTQPLPHGNFTSSRDREGTYLDTVWGKDIKAALVAAARASKLELTQGTPGHVTNRTIYAYDCLGGLRFEARKRGAELTIKRT